jgi:hypothetical protein
MQSMSSFLISIKTLSNESYAGSGGKWSEGLSCCPTYGPNRGERERAERDRKTDWRDCAWVRWRDELFQVFMLT